MSLRTPAVTQALTQQEGLYTVLERQDDRIRAQVVATLCQCLFQPSQPLLVHQALADPRVHIVTLSITAAGYGLHPCTSGLQAWQSEFMDDVRREIPRTAIGVLVKALQQRRQLGMAPPVVLSCDNLPSNGRLLRRLCCDHASLIDDRLASWIASEVQFPCTMVDRIVPPTSAQDLFDARTALGLMDTVPVPTEPFRQWVIERFDGPRPRWEAAGAQYVDDVSAWEMSKLRLLNGGHLAIACLGQLAGCATVAQVMALPGAGAFVHRFLVDEQRPTLPASDHDIEAYAQQLLARLRNPGIAHQLQRIIRDSACKLAPRLLDPLRDNRRAGRPTPCGILVLAAWMRCMALSHEGASSRDSSDPVERLLHRCAHEAAGHPERLVRRMLAIEALFGKDLQDDEALQRALCQAMRSLHERGPCRSILECMATTPIDCQAAVHAA